MHHQWRSGLERDDGQPRSRPLLDLADGAAQPASLRRDLAVWLSFDAQLPSCEEVPRQCSWARPSFTNPIDDRGHHENLQVFSRLYLPRRTQLRPAQASPGQPSPCPRLGTAQHSPTAECPDGRGSCALEKRQSASQMLRARCCQMQSGLSRPTVRQSDLGQARPSNRCVSSGSRQKLPCCSLARLAPRL